MRSVTRVCARAARDQPGVAWPSMYVAGAVMLLASLAMMPMQTAFAGSFLVDLWLLLVLMWAYVIWVVLRARYGLDRSAEAGFALAALGLASRVLCDVYLYGIGGAIDVAMAGESGLEQLVAAERGGALLVATHRWGGLVAYALGLALVAWSACYRHSASRESSVASS